MLGKLAKRLLPALAAIVLFVAATSASATHSPSDVDGDGWANSTDNCPNVYNDRGAAVQSDLDSDGIGDACDPTPFPPDPNATDWGYVFYFVDASGEPAAPTTCATLTVTEAVHYGPPYNFDSTNVSGPYHICAADGRNAWTGYDSRGNAITSLSRTYAITCDGGGSSTGTLADAIVNYVPISVATCARAEMHLYGGGSTGNPPSYAALGDSYSSGEGNPPFLAGTNGNGDFCHRSPLAYPVVLGGTLGASPLFYACSGATTANITTKPKDTEPAQISQPGINPSLDLLTMTIGGNDAGFSHVLTACIEQKLKAEPTTFASSLPLIGPVARALGLGSDPSCAHSSKFTESVDQGVSNIFWPVKNTYKDILGKVDPVKTSVDVADYPLLFPLSHDQQGCLELSTLLTHDDMDFLNGEGNHLDNVLRQAAGEAGVNFVDVRSAFSGHEVCGSGGAYLNGISLASGGGGSCTWKVAGQCIIPGKPVGSFHPNADGHALGYTQAFTSYFGSATDLTPAGLPANPVALPDPPAVTTTPELGFGDLDVHATTAGSADCEGTLQAGQQLTFSGSGYAPGASVDLVFTSPGVDPSMELKVATVTADSAGSVSGTIRIPVSATGFVPSGAAAGMIFLDAVGAGAAAGTQDDVAMIGFASHDSVCGTVEPFPFSGFAPPVANLPPVNKANPGEAIPVKFDVAGSNGTLDTIIAPGYPQSAPVPCTAPGEPTSGDSTIRSDNGSPPPSDSYQYVWKTDGSWTGCRALIVKLVDGTYHRALFDFGT